MQIQTGFYFVQIVPFLGEILLAAVLIHSVDWRIYYTGNFYQNFKPTKRDTCSIAVLSHAMPSNTPCREPQFASIIRAPR